MREYYLELDVVTAVEIKFRGEERFCFRDENAWNVVGCLTVTEICKPINFRVINIHVFNLWSLK